MKHLLCLTLLTATLLALTACAGSGQQQVKVKCPACGYEFMAPVDR